MNAIAGHGSVALVADRRGSVIVYAGKRGRVFRLRYRDAAGVRVLETLGAEADGWTETRAKDILRERLVDVKRERRRKVAPITLAEFARDWLPVYVATKALKKSTRESYESILELHLATSKLGAMVLATVDVDDVERYVAAKRRAGLSPGSVNRHLNLLSLIFAAARKRQLVRENPIPQVDRPREPRRRWRILTPAEIARVAQAFAELAASAPLEGKVEDTRAWILQARVVFLVVVACGLRRGEVLGLHWRSVQLAVDAVLRVEETWVRGQRDTPKSEAGERTIALDAYIADELFKHRGRSSFAGDDERVFCHPSKGSPLDAKLYAGTLQRALVRAKVDASTMRPFHDGRHTSLTNAAASGNAPVAIQARAGHSSFSTTQRYIDLAGVQFRDEADQLGQHLFGARSGKSSGKSRVADDEIDGLDCDETPA